MKRHGILRLHNIPRIWGSKSVCPMTKSIANVHLQTHSQLTGHANIAKELDWTPRLQFAQVWLKPLLCLYTSGKQASSFATLDQCWRGGFHKYVEQAELDLGREGVSRVPNACEGEPLLFRPQSTHGFFWLGGVSSYEISVVLRHYGRERIFLIREFYSPPAENSRLAHLVRLSPQ